MNTLSEKLLPFLRESQLKLTKHFTLSENCFLQPFKLEQEMNREKKASGFLRCYSLRYLSKREELAGEHTVSYVKITFHILREHQLHLSLQIV
jgi:hypothetical protein